METAGFTKLFLFLAFLLGKGTPLIFKGTLRTHKAFTYIDRFLHRPTPEEGVGDESYSMMTFNITHPMNIKLSLMLYHDTFPNWRRLYNSKASEMDCQNMVHAAGYYRHLWMDVADFTALGPENFAYKNLVATTQDYFDMESSEEGFSELYADFLEQQPANHSYWFTGNHSFCNASNSITPVPNNATCESWPGHFVDIQYSEALDTVTYSGSYAFASENPTWSFIALANCDLLCYDKGDNFCQGPLSNVKYYFEFTNGLGASKKHFSFEQIGLMDTQIVLWVFTTLLWGFALWVRSKLVAKRRYHHTARLLLCSIALAWLGLVLGMAYYGTVAWQGYGDAGALTGGRILFRLADALLVLLLVLLAKGWTIVRPKISVGGRVKLAVFGTLYGFASLVGAVWHDGFADPHAALYFYDSDAGLLLLLLRLGACAWFKYAAWTTKRQFPEKVPFYSVFNKVAFAWLLSTPMAALLALSAPLYERDKAVFVMERVFFFLAQLVLAVLYNPDGPLRRSFPFHTTAHLGKDKAATRAVARNGTLQTVDNRTGLAASVTGLPGTRSAEGKVVVLDGFEQEQVRRLRQLQAHVDNRLKALQGYTRALGGALDQVHAPPSDGWQEAGSNGGGGGGWRDAGKPAPPQQRFGNGPQNFDAPAGSSGHFNSVGLGGGGQSSPAAAGGPSRFQTAANENYNMDSARGGRRNSNDAGGNRRGPPRPGYRGFGQQQQQAIKNPAPPPRNTMDDVSRKGSHQGEEKYDDLGGSHPSRPRYDEHDEDTPATRGEDARSTRSKQGVNNEFDEPGESLPRFSDGDKKQRVSSFDEDF